MDDNKLNVTQAELRDELAKAIANSVSADVENLGQRLWDVLDFSGENKAHMVCNAAADACLAIITPLFDKARVDALEEAAAAVLRVEPPYLLGQMEIGDQVIRQCATAIRELKGKHND